MRRSTWAAASAWPPSRPTARSCTSWASRPRSWRRGTARSRRARGPGAHRSWSCRLGRRAGRWPAPWAGPRAAAACRCMPGADVPVARRAAPALSLTLPLSCLHLSGARPQDVYVEDLLHRDPGDPSTLAPAEAAFAPLVRAWMEAERAGAAAAAAAAAAGSGPAQGASFTRVVVSSLKPEILAQIADDEGGQQLCRRAAPAGRRLDARAAPLARMLCLQAAGRAGVCMRSATRSASRGAASRALIPPSRADAPPARALRLRTGHAAAPSVRVRPYTRRRRARHPAGTWRTCTTTTCTARPATARRRARSAPRRRQGGPPSLCATWPAGASSGPWT